MYFLSQEVLEECFGAASNCSAINDVSTENQFVVATDDVSLTTDDVKKCFISVHIL